VAYGTGDQKDPDVTAGPDLTSSPAGTT